METLMKIVETVLVVVAGLTLRALIAVAGLAIVVIPILALFVLVRSGGSLGLRLQGFARAGSLLMKRRFFYAPGHTWLQEDASNVLRVGLDDLAQRILAGAGSFRVAEPGKHLRRGDTLAEFRLAHRAARIPAPVEGTVLGVNEAVLRSPELTHRDPYRQGWLAMLAPADAAYRRLPTENAARGWLESEDRRLAQFFEAHLGAAAADGGEFVSSPPALLDDRQWSELMQQFLEDDARHAA